MNTVEQFFSTRAWNRLVINVVPGFVFLLLLGIANQYCSQQYCSLYYTYVKNNAIVWPVSIAALFISLVIGLTAEELAGYLEGKIYDSHAAKYVEVPEDYVESKHEDRQTDFFYSVWDKYLLTKVDAELPISSYYRNRLIGYKFLLTLHVVFFGIFLVMVYGYIAGQLMFSLCHLTSVSVAIGIPILRLRSVARTLHDYRLMIVGYAQGQSNDANHK